MPRKYRQSFLSLRRRECLNAWLTWGPSKYREAAAQSSTLKGQAPTLRRDQAMKGMEGASGQVKLHRYVARGRPGSPDFDWIAHGGLSITANPALLKHLID